MPLNLIQWLTLALAFTVAVTTPVLFSRLDHVQQHQNDALRTIICRAETVITSDSKITAARRRQALTFYEQALAAIQARPCAEGAK